MKLAILLLVIMPLATTTTSGKRHRRIMSKICNLAFCAKCAKLTKYSADHRMGNLCGIILTKAKCCRGKAAFSHMWLFHCRVNVCYASFDQCRTCVPTTRCLQRISKYDIQLITFALLWMLRTLTMSGSAGRGSQFWNWKYCLLFFNCYWVQSSVPKKSMKPEKVIQSVMDNYCIVLMNRFISVLLVYQSTWIFRPYKTS